MTPFDEAVERATKAGPQTNGYIASGEDLGLEIREFYRVTRLHHPLPDVIEGACHTVIVALVGYGFANDKAWGQFIDKASSYTRVHAQHSVLLFARDEATGRKLLT